MKRTIAVAGPILLFASLVSAQQVPTQKDATIVRDCRVPQLAPGERCIYVGHDEIPVQRYIGDINLPPMVHMTEPFSIKAAVVPVAKTVAHTSIYALFTHQMEGLQPNGFVATDYWNSDGLKLGVTHDWKYLGGDFRITDIRYGVIPVGSGYGDNNTDAVEVGPRVHKNFGRLTPYGEGLIGYMYQYRPAMSLSLVGGLDLRLSKHAAWRLFDYTYRDAQMTPITHPKEARYEFSSGLVWQF